MIVANMDESTTPSDSLYVPVVPGDYSGEWPLGDWADIPTPRATECGEHGLPDGDGPHGEWWRRFINGDIELVMWCGCSMLSPE